MAREQRDDGSILFRTREDEDDEQGYLYASSANPWPEHLGEAIEQRRFPDSWLAFDGARAPRSSRRAARSGPRSRCGCVPTAARGARSVKGCTRPTAGPVPLLPGVRGGLRERQRSGTSPN